MAISLVGSNNGTSTCTITAHSVGDLLLAFAFRTGSNSTPTLPTGWTSLNTVVTNSAGSIMAYKIATATNDTSGTWSNGTNMIISVYTGTNTTSPIGGHAVATGTGTTVSYPALTMTNSSGSSWVAGLGTHRSTNTTIDVAPTGMTNRKNSAVAGEISGNDTNGGVTSWSLTTESVGGTSSGWGCYTVELLASGNAKVETLQDPFNITSLQTSLWSQFTGGSATFTYATTGAQVNYPSSSTSSTDGDLSSVVPYNLTNSYASINVITVPSAATSADAAFRFQTASNNYVHWLYEGGTLFAQYDVAGSKTTPFSVAYSSTTHAYWRIREGTGAGAGGTAGTTYWDTSTDGVSWTNRASVTTPITATGLTAVIAGTCFQAETNPGVFKWNNFNAANSSIAQVGGTLTATTGTQVISAGSPPTVALNTPLDTGTVATTTPTLDFTGADADGDAITYEAQVDTVNTFDSSAGIIASNPVSNYDATDDQPIGVGTGTTAYGQSFVGNGSKIGTAKFYASQSSATGNITAKVYAHSGTFGTSSVPTGSALATSDVLNASTIGSSKGLVALSFSGANQITLTNSTDYVIVLDATALSAGTITLGESRQGTVTVPGNVSVFNFGTTWAASANDDAIFSVYDNNNAPLLDKFSATDTGFLDITNGAHTNPFASGDQIGYTVQAGNALTNSTTYYWRVRGKDPSGTNTYGSWATTQSFTVSTGGGAVNGSVTQLAANLTATGGSQTVVTIRDVSISQVAGSLTATGGTQTLTAIQDAAIAQSSANLTASGGTQTVATANDVAITQSGASITATTGTQSFSAIIVVSASVTQLAASLTMAGGTQIVSVAVIASGSVTQVGANLTATGGTQTVSTIRDSTVTQSAATLTATGGAQTVSATILASASIIQVAANITATGGIQSVANVNGVSITQVAANVTASGGSQTLVSVQDIAISQVGATLAMAGGTQTIGASSYVSVAQTAAALATTGGTQVVQTVRAVQIAQLAATLTAAGGTQTISTVNYVAFTQSAAVLTASGGTQAAVAGSVGNISISQLGATLTASGGSQTIASVRDSSITQSAATLTITGGTQTVAHVNGVTVTQVAATLTVHGGTQTTSAVSSSAVSQIGAHLLVMTYSPTLFVGLAVGHEPIPVIWIPETDGSASYTGGTSPTSVVWTPETAGSVSFAPGNTDDGAVIWIPKD